MIIKICGITREQDVRAAIAAGANWIGFNFWPPSPRAIDVAVANRLADVARSCSDTVVLVGVFVNASDRRIREVSRSVGLDRWQLHGDEVASRIEALGSKAFQAIGLATAADCERAAGWPGSPLLVDAASPAHGGSGRCIDWDLARQVFAKRRDVILAGGLRPDNVATAVSRLRPFGVDVASGVEERPGCKHAARMAAFVAATRAAASADSP